TPASPRGAPTLASEAPPVRTHTFPHSTRRIPHPTRSTSSRPLLPLYEGDVRTHRCRPERKADTPEARRALERAPPAGGESRGECPGGGAPWSLFRPAE